MRVVSALLGAAMLGGVALSAAAASAMPVTIPSQAPQASNVEQVNYVCNPWRCWHRPFYGDGYYHPHYYGGWSWPGGWGYGWHRWHHWHRWWHHW